MFWLALFLLLPQRGTYYEYYETGIKKFQQEDFLGAFNDLEKAIELRPKSTMTARTYSVRTMAYHPYHYLAEAGIRLEYYQKAKEYRDKAYRYREETFEDGAYAVSLDLLGLALPTHLRTLDGSALAVKDPIEEFPVVILILKKKYDEALVHVENLIKKHPEDKNLSEMKSHLFDLREGSREQLRIKETQVRKLENALELARTFQLNDEYRKALSHFQDARALDPENPEAARAIPLLFDALEDKWIKEGKGDEFLKLKEELKEEFDAKIRAQAVLLREAEAERQRLEAEVETSRELLTKSVRGFSPTPLPPRVHWGVRPLSNKNYTANIQVEITSDVDMNKASLYLARDDKFIKEWVLDGDRYFRSPWITYDFENINGDLYMVVEGDQSRDRSDYPYFFKSNVVPFYKKKRFNQALSASLSLLIAGVFFWNHMRRRRAFRLRFNPYVAGAPILTDEMFYGRDATMKQMLNTLHNNSLMIYGERRIGKTSFLHRLNKELGHHDDPLYTFVPVFIDLQGVAEEDFFHVMDQEIGLVLEDFEIRLDPTPEQLSGRGFISRLRAYISEMKKYFPKKPKLVLLLDEVDVMNGYSEHTNQKLRSVFMKGFADHIVAVMAGININTRWKSEGSPWYNFFEQIELKPFNRSLADSLVQKPVQGIYQYSNQAVERIMEITGGKPYLIQKMCLNLISHILVENKRKVTKEDVDFVYEGIKNELFGG